jgi:hypothetical protein
MEWHGLSTREWAIIFWASVLLVLGVALPFARSAFAPFLRTLLRFWQLHLAFLALAGWIAGVLYLAHLVGAWNRGLLKDTIAWFLLYGFATVFAATEFVKVGETRRC